VDEASSQAEGGQPAVDVLAMIQANPGRIAGMWLRRKGIEIARRKSLKLNFSPWLKLQAGDRAN
jgi:hypothetical protein